MAVGAGRKPILLWALSGLVVACGILTAYFLLQTDCHVTGKDTKECDKHPMPDWLAVVGTAPPSFAPAAEFSRLALVGSSALPSGL